eukprot:12949838-Alexandrium_andersonii.AAC.1
MEAGEFVDVAALPGLGRQQDMLAPTCFAHSAREGSRRDFVFVQPCLAQMVCSFLVRPAAGYDVHAPVRVAFRVPQSIMVRQLVVHDAYPSPPNIKQREWEER